MRIVARLLLCAFAGFALICGLVWGLGQVRGGVFRDLDLAGAGRLLTAELRKQDDLDVRNEAALRCMQGKGVVTTALLAGKLSLSEAAEAFRQLDEECGEPLVGPEPQVDERAAASEGADYENVMLWAEAAAQRNPDQAPRLAQLQAEWLNQPHHPADRL